MKKLLIIPISLMMILVLPLVLGFGPNTHNQICMDILSRDNTEFGQLCSFSEENKAAFMLGCITPDITVAYYYTQGGSEYRISHNWNFADALMSEAETSDERCLVYGVSTHLAADGISHTVMNPKAIEQYKFPNWILHPLLEKKFDSDLAIKYPDLTTQTPHMMDALDGERGERYIQMIKNAMGSNSQINAKEELSKLRLAISGGDFYNSQFTPSTSTNLVFQSYIYIDKLTNYAAPYVGQVNFGNMEFYFQKAEQQTTNIFNNWGARYQISPHGFVELSAADQAAGNTISYILMACIFLPLFLAIRYRNQSKYYLWWLALIPLLIIAVIIVVYALI